ncbi:MAG: thioesterase II family protein [Niastella sp.]|uniref:thioesterase II family protein n=1 Tax=Niastella sp. TaxID=1869183 RepID=UPI00389A7023
MRKTKLFCLPYAGGSASIYNRWKQHLGADIELVTIELAGKGRRIGESLYQDLSEAVQDVYKIIKKDLADAPYALFGHSMGGLISYELAQRIRANGLPAPVHIFFSGKSAPHIEREDEKKYHLMDDEEFERELIHLGGTPPEFFESPELAGIFLPILRSDFKMAQTTTNKGVIYPLNIPITVFLGKKDDQTPEQCDGWKFHTTKGCTLHYFEGGHFFLHDEMDPILKIINRTIRDSYDDGHL